LDPILVRDIQLAERCDLLAYLDTNGFWTIGWGHKLPVRAAGWRGLIWDPATADNQLEADILDAGKHAMALPEWMADDSRARRNALVELVFNMGCTKWQTFVKTRDMWRHLRWNEASENLKDSLWYRQVGKTRGDRLADYLKLGSYPPSVAASSLFVSSSSAWPHGFALAAA
jgi:GH24 family phage-related lysozyme (muramidase)